MADSASAKAEPSVLVLTNQPAAWRDWWADVFAHRDVLGTLARKDFQTRYKRATLGVAWIVVVPILQGLIMAAVFSKVVRIGKGHDFAAYVMSGMLAWSFFSSTISSAATAIVDGSGLSDKVWFPRALLVAVPVLANSVGLAVSMTVLLALLPVLHGVIGVNLLLLLPGIALLLLFTISLGLVLSALHVYFRDVRFIVQAALVVWLYLTPLVYAKETLGRFSGWVDFNPMTGIATIFHEAVTPDRVSLDRSVIISVVFTVVLFVAGVVGQRKHDRLFVDLL